MKVEINIARRVPTCFSFTASLFSRSRSLSLFFAVFEFSSLPLLSLRISCSSPPSSHLFILILSLTSPLIEHEQKYFSPVFLHYLPISWKTPADSSRNSMARSALSPLIKAQVTERWTAFDDLLISLFISLCLFSWRDSLQWEARPVRRHYRLSFRESRHIRT